jgi:hypothetical protein
VTPPTCCRQCCLPQASEVAASLTVVLLQSLAHLRVEQSEEKVVVLQQVKHLAAENDRMGERNAQQEVHMQVLLQQMDSMTQVRAGGGVGGEPKLGACAHALLLRAGSVRLISR